MNDRGNGPKVVGILGFHKIGPAPGGWETWYYISAPAFAAYLRRFREDGWQFIDLATLLRGLEAPESLPARAALVTFDDGYRSILRWGLPALVELRCPAVMFVPTDYIGGRNLFDHDNEPDEAICTWDDLRELERQGVAVQPHGASHRAFSDLGLAEREEELYRSKAVLEDGLGKPMQVFSFPYGDNGTDPGAVEGGLRRLGYRAACLYGGGVMDLRLADPYRLARVAMGPDMDLEAELWGQA
jgi:peptidoglycan/xylan/chitin deacetylase (PgdA/CDA1 family)